MAARIGAIVGRLRLKIDAAMLCFAPPMPPPPAPPATPGQPGTSGTVAIVLVIIIVVCALVAPIGWASRSHGAAASHPAPEAAVRPPP